MALGVTIYLPDDRHNYTREYLETRLATLYGVAWPRDLPQADVHGRGQRHRAGHRTGALHGVQFGMTAWVRSPSARRKSRSSWARDLAAPRFSEDNARQIDLEVRA